MYFSNINVMKSEYLSNISKENLESELRCTVTIKFKLSFEDI